MNYMVLDIVFNLFLRHVRERNDDAGTEIFSGFRNLVGFEDDGGNVEFDPFAVFLRVLERISDRCAGHGNFHDAHAGFANGRSPASSVSESRVNGILVDFDDRGDGHEVRRIYFSGFPYAFGREVHDERDTGRISEIVPDFESSDLSRVYDGEVFRNDFG